jgi:CO/xanthine dehydrogenase Mo-binding subunit
VIGDSIARLEDRPLLTGRAIFVADISLPGQLSMRVLRSPIASGEITSIDTTAARAMDGVVAVWTGRDLDLPPIAFRQVSFEQMLPYRQPVLAKDRVRYVGEPIAIIVAENAYIAEDAEELISVDIDPLEPTMDATGQLGEFAPGLDTEALQFEFEYGALDEAFVQHTRHVEVKVRIGRHSGVPMECRGGVADFNPGTGVLTVYGAAKVPHYNRDAIASMLGMSPSRVIFKEQHVGGGFGIRGELYPEDVLLAWASRELGRPISWIEDRREHLVAANHSRDQFHILKAAVDDSGYIHGLADEFWLDQGAYVRTHAATVPTLTATMLPGPYEIPAYRVRGHVRLTNKTPAGTYRAPGRYEGTFARERLIDAIAQELDLDPMDVRERNFIRSDQMPFSRPLEALGTAIEYDSGDYSLLVKRAEDQWKLSEVEREVAERRSRGELVGIGRAFFVEKSGLGPFEGVRVTVDESGRIDVLTGGASVGQGFSTVMAQICGDVLSIDPSLIDVRHGQTDAFPYGMGAFASRLTVMAGTAVHQAATLVKEKAFTTVASMLEASVNDLELVNGSVQVKGSPDTAIDLGSVATALRPVSARKLGLEPGLGAEHWFFSDHMNYPYGYHIALVSIDPELGSPKVERYWIAYDIGKAVNPMLVEGQIVGGAAQGLGGALLESFEYDEHGQPLCTTFMDYMLPTVAEMPPVEVLITEDAPSPLNPLGLKGAGEGGTTAFGAAIASAVDAAIPGTRVSSIPISPEQVRGMLALMEKRNAGNGGHR